MLVLLVVITVVIPGVKVLFESKGRQPNEKEIKSVIDFLPRDGIYSAPHGSGGNYRDPIKGLFEVERLSGFDLWEGETRTWVSFTKEPLEISVQAFVPKDELGRIDPSTEFQSKRFVTIDGTKALEALYAFRGKQILWIRYEKYGFIHEIHIRFPYGKFPKYSGEVLAFLRSYRSIKPK